MASFEKDINARLEFFPEKLTLENIYPEIKLLYESYYTQQQRISAGSTRPVTSLSGATTKKINKSSLLKYMPKSGAMPSYLDITYSVDELEKSYKFLQRKETIIKNMLEGIPDSSDQKN